MCVLHVLYIAWRDCALSRNLTLTTGNSTSKPFKVVDINETMYFMFASDPVNDAVFASDHINDTVLTSDTMKLNDAVSASDPVNDALFMNDAVITSDTVKDAVFMSYPVQGVLRSEALKAECTTIESQNTKYYKGKPKYLL